MASRAFDTFVTYKIISQLVTDWEDMPAFEHGIIDKKGKLLRKHSSLKTTEEKESYTLFTRLIFNLKRLIQKKRQFENVRIKTFMTKNPYIVDENTLASEILLQMNKRKITNVCVYKNNNKKRTIGVIHIHNLLSILK